MGIIRSLVHTNGDHDAAVMATQAFWRTIGPASLYPSIASVMSYYFTGLTAINVPAPMPTSAANAVQRDAVPAEPQ